MKISEIETIKAKTPEQQRINALQQQKDRASKALNSERESQKQHKAKKKIAKAYASLTTANH